MGRSDPALTYLKSSGYSVVRLPRRDIDPLLLLQRNGRELSRLGPADTLFTPAGKPLPVVKKDVPAADVRGSVTTTLSLGLGLSLLGNFLEAFGAQGAGLEVEYHKARTVTFEFTGLLSDTIDLTTLDQFLATAKEDLASRHLKDLLEADEVYCVTTTLKSRSFTVDAKGESGTKVKLSAPAIQQAVGVKVGVAAEKNSTSKIAYTGESPLVFGFQATQLFFQDGEYQAFKPTGAGSVVLRGLGKKAKGAKKIGKKGSKPREYLVADGAFVSLD
jgi:hypothetical protein